MKRPTIVLCANMLIAASGLGIAAPISAQSSNTGQVIGHVTDEVGGVISRASVFVRRRTPSEDNVRLVIRTDINGDFTLVLPEGGYDVLITSPGFAAGVRTVAVVRGKKNTFEWRLTVLKCDYSGMNCDTFQ